MKSYLKQTFNQQHPRIILLLLVIIAITISDLGFGILYKIARGESFYYSAVDPSGVNRRYRRSSPIYHHDLAANVSMPATWGGSYKINTNSLGFKDSEPRHVPLKVAGRRMVLIGDSFTEGVGFSFKDTFAGLLSDHYGSKGIDVLNAGVSSYSPTIYYRKTRYLLENVGLSFTDLVVFLDLSDAQDDAWFYYLDEQDNVINKKDFLSPAKIFFRSYSILYAIPRIFKQRAKAKEFKIKSAMSPINLSISTPRGAWTVDDELYKSYGRIGLRKMTEHMDRLHNLLQMHGISLAVVVYPWPTQIYHGDLESRQVTHWRAWSQKHEVQFINMFPGFISEDQKINENMIKQLFVAHDFHWNKKGHAHVAKLFTSLFGLKTHE